MLNFVVSDGATMVATRYISGNVSPGEQPASLYFAEGSDFERTGERAESALRALNGLEGAVGARSKSVTGEQQRGPPKLRLGSAW